MPGAELEAGRAFVDLVPRLERGFGRSVENELDGPLSRIQGRFAGLGRGIAIGLGGGVAAGAGALFTAALTIDDALDSIRISTGATGDELAGLEGTFRNVAARVPGDFGVAADAISELAQRTDSTGPALEELAVQVLTLSRLTGEDLGTTIANSTRLFGDWGVAVEDQAGTLDLLFRASQQTGIGMGDLEGALVQFGAPLRQLGFSIEESAALLGSFEREGVNAELVLGSFRQALGRMARAGEPAQETLARVTDEIANAGSTSEANALALELFGARAGPDMAAAIREGRFEIDDLVTSISSGGDTIAGAADATDGLGETFGRLKNRVLLAVEPLATRFLGAVEDLLPKVEPLVDWLGEKLPLAFESIRDAVVPVVDRIRRDFLPVLEEKVLPILRTVADFVGRNLKPILIGLAGAFLLITAPLTTVGAALVAAYLKFEGFRNVVDAVVRFLVEEVAPRVAAFAAGVAEVFGELVDWVREHWAGISEAVSHAVNVIEAIVSTAVDAILLVWHYFGDTILSVISGAWETVKGVVEFAIDFVRGVIEAGIALINGDWGAAWDAIVGILRDAWELAQTVVGAAIDAVKALIGDGISAAADAVSGAVDRIVGFFGGMGRRIANVAGDVFGFLWESFREAINAIIRGWNGLEFEIPGFDPPGPGSIPGFTLGVPDIPELAAGGSALRGGLSIVGDGGIAELLAMPAGASVVPLDVARMIAGAALEGRGDGLRIENLNVENPVDATADETVAAIGAKLGWQTLTTRRDR